MAQSQQPVPGKMQHSVSFKTDLSNVGRSGSRLFGGGSGPVNILDEEKRLIDKVFSIVDKDNSGSVDTEELKEMFKFFGVNSTHLTSAITRAMKNVDKDFDGMISPDEFYKLLSQKFEKGDPLSEIKTVYNSMDDDKDNKLDVEDLYKVSQKLGERISKDEIKHMIKTFNRKYQEDLKKYQQELKVWTAKKKKGARDAGEAPREPPEPRFLDLDDFYAVMQEEL